MVGWSRQNATGRCAKIPSRGMGRVGVTSFQRKRVNVSANAPCGGLQSHSATASSKPTQPLHQLHTETLPVPRHISDSALTATIRSLSHGTVAPVVVAAICRRRNQVAGPTAHGDGNVAAIANQADGRHGLLGVEAVALAGKGSCRVGSTLRYKSVREPWSLV